MGKRKMNWSQTRNEIDSGRTQDKVDYPDPAAAPLGTDEEAGGAHTPVEEIAASVRKQKSPDAKKSGSKDPDRHIKP